MKKRIVRLFFFIWMIFFGGNFCVAIENESTSKPPRSKKREEKRKKNVKVVTGVVRVTGKFAKKKLRGLVSKLIGPFKKVIKKKQRAIKENPYSKIVAEVRTDGPVSEGEKAFLKKRERSVRRALHHITGIWVPKTIPVPSIAISLSGGGSRAMVVSWAFVRALELAGLLDSIQLMTALSGSTWFLWPWLASGLTLEQYKERLMVILQRGAKFKPTKGQLKNVGNFILRAAVFDRPLTIVDFFSCLLGFIHFYDLGLNNDPLQTYLDAPNIQRAIESARVPYPLLTFVSLPDRRWFSVTPHEVGSVGLGFIPWWAFGRRFRDGKSINEGGRIGIQEFNAISSAIMAQPLHVAYDSYVVGMKNNMVKKILQALMKDWPTRELRPLYAEEFNPFYGLKELPLLDDLLKKSWGKFDTVEFADAAFSNNYPIVPILERARSNVPTIIFAADASRTIGPAVLKKLKQYTDGDNPNGTRYSFPDPDQGVGLEKRGMSILKNDDVLLFLFPRVIDKNLLQAYKKSPIKKINGINLEPYARRLTFDMDKRIKGIYNTYNFKYSKDETEDLAAVMIFNVLANLEKIRRTMRNFIRSYVAREKKKLRLKRMKEALFFDRRLGM